MEENWANHANHTIFWLISSLLHHEAETLQEIRNQYPSHPKDQFLQRGISLLFPHLRRLLNAL